MQLTETIKLYPTKYQEDLILSTMNEYIATVNSLVSDATKGNSISNISSKDVNTSLPSALKNQCIRDAKSIVKKHYKACKKAVLKNKKHKTSKFKILAPKLPILKKPCCYINNQNFKIKDNSIEFPIIINGKSKRIFVKTKITNKQKGICSSYKLGTLRIVVKNKHLVAQVIYDIKEQKSIDGTNVMGIDLGIKCPAVSYCSDGSVKFYGNGRKNKYLKRQYKYLRKKLQTKKKPTAVKRINDKEQRVMKDIDHKISHEIVKTAVEHNVSIIKLEQLSNIRSTTRTSRKNNHSLHTWSFYRLAQFIEYKAKLAGIVVEYVNPMYTSQKCPKCNGINHATDRYYACKCGYYAHRDIVGAINIANSTEYVGKRHTA